MTRSFPRDIEFLLPLKMSARNYGEDEGVIVVSSNCPISILGHGVYVRGIEKSSGFMNICEPIYSHTNASTIMNVIRTDNSKALKWINKYNGGENKPVTPPNAWPEKSFLVCSDYAPLSAYTNIAVLDRGVPLRSPMPSCRRLWATPRKDSQVSEVLIGMLLLPSC
ncbi:hypothetical protein PG991_009237 [Apiospora marii]|uniref:Uncharacterized protein n=1 Tax=Apiospora marii TaxID=335849 RepID=A0ABR1RK37_9PEZI